MRMGDWLITMEERGFGDCDRQTICLKHITDPDLRADLANDLVFEEYLPFPVAAMSRTISDGPRDV